MGLSKIARVIAVGLLLSIVACHKQPQNALGCPNGTWCQIGASQIYFAYIPNFQDTSCVGSADCPEFAVLRMPNSVYQAFNTACQNGTGVTWINSNAKVFSQLLKNMLTPCPQVAPPTGGSPYTFVIVPHWPNSTAAPAGYPQTAPQ